MPRFLILSDSGSELEERAEIGHTCIWLLCIRSLASRLSIISPQLASKERHGMHLGAPVVAGNTGPETEASAYRFVYVSISERGTQGMSLM